MQVKDLRLRAKLSGLQAKVSRFIALIRIASQTPSITSPKKYLDFRMKLPFYYSICSENLLKSSSLATRGGLDEHIF